MSSEETCSDDETYSNGRENVSDGGLSSNEEHSSDRNLSDESEIEDDESGLDDQEMVVGSRYEYDRVVCWFYGKY